MDSQKLIYLLRSAGPGYPLILCLLFLAACGTTADNDTLTAVPESTYIFGNITVDEALDDTRNHSGISVIVVDGPAALTASATTSGPAADTASPAAGPDTLFRAVTNRSGDFEGTARIPGQGIYELQVHRNNRRIADTTIVLAHQDTVWIEGFLPRFSGFARIISAENEAMRMLNRLERQYQRVLQIAAAGGVPQDTIPHLINTWSDIFWDAYKKWPGTIAGKIASRESLNMLDGHDDQKLMQRLRMYGGDEHVRMLAARFGFLTELRENGLDAAIAWIDSLESESNSHDVRVMIAKNRLEVLYDSSRIDDAKTRLRDFENAFSGDDEALAWLDFMRYDIEYLSPGQMLPFFKMEFAALTDIPVFEPFGLEGHGGPNRSGTGSRQDMIPATGELRILSPDDLSGMPALIEIVSLRDRMYQAVYPQLRTMHLVFGQEGIRFLTIPVEESAIAVSAFFQERGQSWPVAKPGAYAASDLSERWNIYDLPVRFLIDSDGRIIRKFHGHNLNEIIMELNKITTNGEVL